MASFQEPSSSRPDWALLFARLCMVALFLPSGVGKALQISGVAAYIESKGIPVPILVAGAVVALEVIASLALALGYRLRLAAIALAVFTLLAGVIFHDFWNASAEAASAQRQAFFKNIGIAGGLMSLAAAGAGRFSLGARKAAS